MCAAINQVWSDQAQGDGNYTCPWCDSTLKPKISNSAKNPGRTFVGCSKDYGGCGLFSFLDDAPNEKFNPNKGGGKRARTGGTMLTGAVAGLPGADSKRIADMADQLAQQTSQLIAMQEQLVLHEKHLEAILSLLA
jgi:hypothetical protein